MVLHILFLLILEWPLNDLEWSLNWGIDYLITLPYSSKRSFHYLYLQLLLSSLLDVIRMCISTISFHVQQDSVNLLLCFLCESNFILKKVPSGYRALPGGGNSSPLPENLLKSSHWNQNGPNTKCRNRGEPPPPSLKKPILSYGNLAIGDTKKLKILKLTFSSAVLTTRTLLP